MIEQLDRLIERLDNLPEAVKDEMERLVQEAAALLLDINRDYIRKTGRDVSGQVIHPQGYSPAYAKFKAKYGTKSKQTAYVDLTLTGEFLDSLELVRVGRLRYMVVATDEKYAFLQKYGDLLGVSDADLDDFVATILIPELNAFVGRYFDQ